MSTKLGSEQQPNHPAGLEPLLSLGEVAAYLGVPIATIYDWRCRGQAPPAFRVGKHLRFAVADVQEWLLQHRDL